MTAPDIERGRQVFDQLVEYPLPGEVGVKDYVFYFDAPPYGYFDGARAFLKKHYPNHTHYPPHTLETTDPGRRLNLEQMISRLRDDVASSSGKVKQIRELVIVAHGNQKQLFIPIVSPGTGVDPVYDCLTEFSLSALQKDFALQKFASFEKERAEVVSHLFDDSWITVRACNFGRSLGGLYALYAFFGGKADVYAPTKFTAYFDQPVGRGHRIASTHGAYEYMAKQHFLTTNEHSPGRQATIVADLLDPEDFSMPFQLASAQPLDANAPDVEAFNTLVDELDLAGRGRKPLGKSPSLRAAFKKAGHELSKRAYIERMVENDGIVGPAAVWYVRDRTLLAPETHETLDLVYVVTETTDQGKTLTAAARIDLVSAHASLPIQLLLSERVDNDLSGVVCELAGYAESGPGADSTLKDEFTATKALLDSGSWSNGTIDIAQRINDGLSRSELDLAPLPDPPPPIQPAGAAANGEWTIGGPQPLVVKLEDQPSADGARAQTLTVYLVFGSTRDAKRHAWRVLDTEGLVPDTPGTELPAYLDRLTVDDLVAMIAYLRSAPRPANAFYIHHAGQALRRNRLFREIVLQEEKKDPVSRHFFDSQLQPQEAHDLGEVAYAFEFNDNWSEVKEASPLVEPFHGDLFAPEFDLAEKLNLRSDVTWNCHASEPDSPVALRDDLRTLERQGHEEYFASRSKALWEPAPPVDDEADCADFAAAIAEWIKQLNANVDPTTIRQTLEDLKGEDGESYFDKVKEVYDKLGEGREYFAAVFGDEALPKVSKVVFTPKEWLASKLFPALEGPLEVWSEVDFAVGTPFFMWLHGMEDQAKNVDAWEAIGEYVAIRQWCIQLIDLTRTAPAPFPSADDIQIDLGGADAALDACIAEEQAEEQEAGHGMFVKYTKKQIPYPADLTRGFVYAAEQFGRKGPQIVEQADRAISERLGGLGLGPCKTKALMDSGLIDLDEIRRRVIRRFAEEVRHWVPPII